MGRKKERHPSSQFGDFQSPIKTSILDILTRRFLQYVRVPSDAIKVLKRNMYGWEQCKKKITKMANSIVGYIALQRQLASFAWIGLRSPPRSLDKGMYVF